MNHRGTETQRETQRKTSQTRRHKDTKAIHPPKKTADHADGFFAAAVSRIDGGKVGDLTIADYR
jgi:hypothetical protein